MKRTVPKASNKIQAVAIARLYIAHPSKQRWTYTGLQGAAVLANDLIGNTFWIKLVDVSVSATININGSWNSSSSLSPSLRIVASSGIRKSTIRSLTTKIGHSSIHLSLRIVWQDCPLRMKKRPRPSRRKWMSVKKTPAKTPRRPLFMAQGRWPARVPLRNTIADWEAYCMATVLHRDRTYLLLNYNQ